MFVNGFLIVKKLLHFALSIYCRYEFSNGAHMAMFGNIYNTFSLNNKYIYAHRVYAYLVFSLQNNHVSVLLCFYF